MAKKDRSLYVEKLGEYKLAQEIRACKACRELALQADPRVQKHNKIFLKSGYSIDRVPLPKRCPLHDRRPKRRYGSLRTRRQHKKMWKQNDDTRQARDTIRRSILLDQAQH